MITFKQFFTLNEDSQALIAQLNAQLNALLQQQQPIAKRNADLEMKINKLRADLAKVTAQDQKTNPQQAGQQPGQQPQMTGKTPGATPGASGTPGSQGPVA